ncbi:Alpha-N-arabinofuranosidase [Frigoribacterium sp. JB110]|nr:Alpha-N-arabinofuranosidase [Frigoribacterium sp. JB110]
MTHARITIDRDFAIAEVPRRLFGSFVEHTGHCVCTGIFESAMPRADERGFRRDVLEFVREMGPTVVCCPGGNFSSPVTAGRTASTPSRPDRAVSTMPGILDGTKTGTAAALWDHEAIGERVPEAGDLSIVLNGSELPRALIRTTSIRIVPFDQVDEEHAHAEGEGDRTLTAWREIHERFWRTYGESGRGFAPDMPVVCERFEVVWAAA